MFKTVYLDTTVPSYYYEERQELTAFIDITKRWWDSQKENYEVFISDYTLAELSQGSYPNQDKVIELVAELPIFEASAEIDEIA